MFASIRVLAAIAALMISVSCAGSDAGSYIVIPRDHYLRLAISDEIREQTGLWQDRLHWWVRVLDYESAKSDQGITSEPGKKTVVVFLDHPNGVDKTNYRVNSAMIRNKVQEAVKSVLVRYGWSENYVVHVIYVE